MSICLNVPTPSAVRAKTATQPQPGRQRARSKLSYSLTDDRRYGSRWCQRYSAGNTRPRTSCTQLTVRRVWLR